MASARLTSHSHVEFALNAAMMLVAFLVLNGCQRQGPKTTPWYKITDPTVEIIAVNLAERTDEGARFEVTAQLNNPNDVALPLRRYHLTFDLDRRASVTFRDQANRTLPALGAQQVTMPLAIPADGEEFTAREYRVSGWLTYEPPGEIRRLLTESGVPLPSTAFRSQGQLATSNPN